MRRVLWLHAALDPGASGELRRLGVPAVALDDEDWSSEFIPAARAAMASPAEVVIAPIRAAGSIPLLRDPGAQILIEVDSRAALVRPESGAVLTGLANRISGVVARGPRAAAWASRILGGSTPVWLVPDPAVRKVELAAVALQFGLPAIEDSGPLDAPDEVELWFAEPGDHVEAEEVAALAGAWRGEDPRRLVVAPQLVRNWLTQAGVRAHMIDWSPGALQEAFSRTTRAAFYGAEGYGPARRRVLALRSGAPAAAAAAPPPQVFEPVQVAGAWEEVLNSALGATRYPAARSNLPVRVLVLLDLVQDLDPILPLLDELRRRQGVELQVVVSSWLRRRSPRVAAELQTRGLAFEVHDRPAIVQGSAPSLMRIDAVVVVAESSLSAHSRANAICRRAREAVIPTFAMQHGVENVGLHHIPGEDDADVGADHLFVWFPPDRIPPSAPAALRPRLSHVGRVPPRPADLTDLAGAFVAFDTVTAVFENLHWSRYDQAWRTRFLSDCCAFAFGDPTRAVILKPHHAGLWSVKNRHLIPDWPANLIVADPTDPFWEPYTAGALVQLAEAVITTPSTVALDAVQANKPVAVAAYGLELPAYAPLPLLHSAQDWRSFLASAGSIDDARRRAAFLNRTAQGDQPARAAVDHILAAARERRRVREARQTASRAAG